MHVLEDTILLRQHQVELPFEDFGLHQIPDLNPDAIGLIDVRRSHASMRCPELVLAARFVTQPIE